MSDLARLKRWLRDARDRQETPDPVECAALLRDVEAFELRMDDLRRAVDRPVGGKCAHCGRWS